MTSPVLYLQLVLLDDDARGREQLDVEDAAGWGGDAHVVGDVGRVVDGLALEVGRIVEVEIDALLRTDA